MTIASRIHLFSFRTQKLSSIALKVLGWTRPGRIGSCRIFLCSKFHKILRLLLCFLTSMTKRSISPKKHREPCLLCFLSLKIPVERAWLRYLKLTNLVIKAFIFNDLPSSLLWLVKNVTKTSFMQQ